VKVGEPAGTWTPSVAATTFQQQRTAHPNINAVVTPNDANAAAVIAVLKNAGVKPKTFPTTGQDAQVSGLQNILSGYQCGSVYKPIQLEAQAAAALALYLRAGQTPPSGLVNGTTNDYQEHKDVASVLLTPIWVTPANMKQVVTDGAVKYGQLCTGAYKSKCAAAGITAS
jgi:D-xylose transport system substrate-binding protein